MARGSFLELLIPVGLGAAGMWWLSRGSSQAATPSRSSPTRTSTSTPSTYFPNLTFAPTTQTADQLSADQRNAYSQALTFLGYGPGGANYQGNAISTDGQLLTAVQRFIGAHAGLAASTDLDQNVQSAIQTEYAALRSSNAPATATSGIGSNRRNERGLHGGRRY